MTYELRNEIVATRDAMRSAVAGRDWQRAHALTRRMIGLCNRARFTKPRPALFRIMNRLRAMEA